MKSLNSWRKAITEMTDRNHIDTTPAALQSRAFKIEQVGPEMVAELLLAIAAEKEAQTRKGRHDTSRNTNKL